MYYIVLFNAMVCCVMLRCLAFSCSYQIVFSMATHRCIQYGHTSLYSVWQHIVVFIVLVLYQLVYTSTYAINHYSHYVNMAHSICCQFEISSWFLKLMDTFYSKCTNIV